MSEKNILEEIAEKTRERIRREKLQLPLEQLKALAEKAPQQPSFLEALNLFISWEVTRIFVRSRKWWISRFSGKTLRWISI